MKKLKIFDAVEEVMNMDDLQLIQARKHFKWTYLRSALKELREFIGNSDEESNFLIDAKEKTKNVKPGYS
jgi:hypothetical protein